MGLINPAVLAIFFVAYGLIGIISAVSIMSTDVGPQTALVNSAFSPNELQVDTSLLDATNPFEAVGSAPSSAQNNLGLIVDSLTFQAPIWQYSWAQPITIILSLVTAAYLIVLAVFGIGLVLRAFGR